MGMHFFGHCNYKKALSAGLDAGLTEPEIDRAYGRSGETAIYTASGKAWQLPDAAPLYIALGWEPPVEFVNAIMADEIVRGSRIPVRNKPEPEQIGYLSPQTDTLPMTLSDNIPLGFMRKLMAAMLAGERTKTNTLNLP